MIQGCKIYQHPYCTAKKTKCPIDLHSGFKCGFHSAHYVELEENSTWHHAELVHSLAGNSTSLMRLSELDLSIMQEIMTLERDREITEVVNLVTFYAWLERLSRSAGENTSSDTKVFDDVLLDKLLAPFKVFPRSPYISEETVSNLVKLARERSHWNTVITEAKLDKKKSVMVFDDTLEESMPLKFEDLFTENGVLDHTAWGRAAKLHTWIRMKFS
jgi:hypothetical protein